LKTLPLRIGLIFAAIAPSLATHATLLSDSFLGFGRSALQDALPPRAGNDPFQGFGNPSWVPESSRAGLVHTSGVASLNDRAANEKTTHVLALALQLRAERLSYGFFAIVPTGAQAILDTGDARARTSPWMNMDRQLLYAANVSRSFGEDRYRLGLLLPVSFNADASARTQLATTDVQSRAIVSLKPRVSWGLGLQATPFEDTRWSLSLFYKEASRADMKAEVAANVPLFGLDLSFLGESAYSYDPRRLCVNLVHADTAWSYGLRARYSQWSKFELPFVRVTESTLVIEDAVPSGRAKDVWDLALGAERRLAETQALALSLGWRQTPFAEVSSFHDSDQLILGLGWNGDVSSLWSLSTTLRLHVLDQGVLYTWVGLGVGYRL
jgi:hypothetical protein